MKEKSQVKIFISYRRKGGIDTARWLHDQLRDRDYNVFLDMEGLRSGAFNTALYHQIKSSDVFLMVLTKDSLKRCRSKNDWVRQELAYAFRCGLNVIPIMKEDFEFPNRLPQDIAPIRSCQGLRISYQFFDAFMEKLEEYILNEPDSLSYIPEPEPTIDWPRYAVAGVALAALLAGVFLLGKGCTNDPGPSGETASSQSTNAPETTAPPSAAGQLTLPPQELGNATGNQCNGGIAANGQYAVYAKLNYLSTLGDARYYYSPSSSTIRYRENSDTSIPIMTQANVDYLLVTTDYLFYTVKDGSVRTLYRYPRPDGANAVERGEVLVSGISSENNLMIDGEFAYYWRYNKGLYRLNLATQQESLLLELEATWTVDMIGKSGNWVYLMTEDTISRVHIGDSLHETVFQLEEHLTDVKLTAGNAADTWIYFSVTDLGEDAYYHHDRAYRMLTDGSSLERIFAADSELCRIERICVTDSLIHFDMECGGSEYCHYYLSLKDWKIGNCEMSHSIPVDEAVCRTVGNTVSNLCNGSIIATRSVNSSYMPIDTVAWYNWFTDSETSYYFDYDGQRIRTTYRENGSFKTSTLLSNVNCSYLHMTTDWLYCVLKEDDTYNLYRAQNNIEQHTIGELELIISDILAVPNRLAIRGDRIYFWVRDKGLFSARTDGTDHVLLFDNGGSGKCYGWITFHADDNYLYFWVSTSGIYAVDLETGKHTHVLNTKEQAGVLAHALAVDGKFAYVVRHETDGVVTAPDELWIVNEDGTDAKQLFVGTDSMHMQALYSSGSRIYLKIVEEGNTTLYKILSEGGELETVTAFD